MNGPRMCRLSIITPCLNRRDFIADAIESVLSQGRDDVEHIVVDGGSTDGTLDVLARYPHLTVTTGPDRGLYDAINKGIAQAKGQIIGHLNSDDVYAEGCFSPVLDAFDAHPDADSVCGIATVWQDTEVGRQTVAEYRGCCQDIEWPTVTTGIPIINARFFRHAVYDRVGHYDLRYPVISDREFLIRLVMAGVGSVSLPVATYHYRQHDGSLTINPNSTRILQGLREKMAIARDLASLASTDGQARRWLEEWHAWEAGEAVRYALARGMFAEALRDARQGIRHQAWWPLSFLRNSGAALGYLPRPRILNAPDS